jgi:hypothetical protein
MVASLCIRNQPGRGPGNIPVLETGLTTSPAYAEAVVTLL